VGGALRQGWELGSHTIVFRTSLAVEILLGGFFTWQSSKAHPSIRRAKVLDAWGAGFVSCEEISDAL
jgi:hypothetical protein